MTPEVWSDLSESNIYCHVSIRLAEQTQFRELALNFGQVLQVAAMPQPKLAIIGKRTLGLCQRICRLLI